jgi:hypothetical protein
MNAGEYFLMRMENVYMNLRPLFPQPWRRKTCSRKSEMKTVSFLALFLPRCDELKVDLIKLFWVTS